ncbi:tRNA (adenosine(37)-N6)-threonylcarbamoyltransferase complex dimerization subunit type 1 TsaB [Chrysiogenes arsenatis]|uniref:tRNA (adenosine(37)-N6)-threonylcarbamoyltransferase complex dimerization subunit type 1 TsaB n=1 Tax=Chrysiogenes arsenatis TaxID=309797 RepID=UPI000413E71B|nr:tRNA (adenosine(37)-N6)-threonylcarbamoyltransferase complex dimerization subunit type 1 TsaB [Chrysiogenes arsenatis]
MLLVLDTSGGSFSAGILGGDGAPYAALEVHGGQTHSLLLPSAIDALLETLECQQAALRGIVFVNGPGSFTGLRVGGSFVKGLAFNSPLKIYCISRLAALLFAYRDFPLPLLVLSDARKGELHCRGLNIPELENDCLLSPEAVLGKIPTDTYVLGEIPERYRDTFTQAKRVKYLPLPPLGFWAGRCIQLTPDYPETPLSHIELLYMRKSEAEVAREERGK